MEDILFYMCFSIFSYRVECKCGFCDTGKQELPEWERHTSSKFRNWRKSIQVKGSMQSLEQWVRIWINLFYFSLPLKDTTFLFRYSSIIWQFKCPIIYIPDLLKFDTFDLLKSGLYISIVNDFSNSLLMSHI